MRVCIFLEVGEVRVLVIIESKGVQCEQGVSNVRVSHS